MNIATVLEDQARRFAAQPAIVERGRSITFAGLDRAAASAAADLRRAGVRGGMRALVFSQMSIALYTTMIALFRLRATAVFVDPSAGRERLDRSVRRVRPDAFVAVPRAHWLRLTSPGIRAIPIKAAIGGDWKGKLSPVLYLSAIISTFRWLWVAQALYVVAAILWLVPDRRIEKSLYGDRA